MIFRSSNPQLMKNIGEGNLAKGIQISFITCKFSYLLMALLSVPLIVKADYVLSLWLKNVPENAVFFCQLTLATNLIIMLARGLNFLIDGIGKIRAYRIALSIFNVLVFPLAYALLYFGFSASSVFASIILSDILVVIARIHYANKYSQMGSVTFIKATILKLVPITLISVAMAYICKEIAPNYDFLNLVICTIVSSVSLSALFYAGALNKEERMFVWEFVKKIVHKILKTK